MAKPRYLIVGKMFLPSVMGGMDPSKSVGSIIETEMSPGPHLKPLNKEARARMEEWYEEALEYTVFDKDTGVPETKVCWPHRKYRIAPPSKSPELQSIKVLREAPKDMPGTMSLAETILKDPSTDQRPGPAVEMDAEGWDEEDIPEPVVAVVQEGASKTIAKRS